MKITLLTSAALLAFPLLMGGAGTARAAAFPEAGQSTSGPAITITFTDSGVTLTQLTNQTYDGSDDVEVGLINNSSSTQTSVTLSGSGNGGGIFAFDGDGIGNGSYFDVLTGKATPGNPADPSGYAGPGVTFSNINTAGTSGTVNFSLAPGSTAYFGLESSPSSITSGGGIVVTPVGPGPVGVPEPASAAILLTAIAAIGFGLRSRKGTAA